MVLTCDPLSLTLVIATGGTRDGVEANAILCATLDGSLSARTIADFISNQK
jgi:hypothetical protein